MSDYIKRENVKKLRDELGDTEADRDYMMNEIDAIPSEDVIDIKNYTICGYSFKDLVVFAEACDMMGVEEEDLKDFCAEATSAYNYMARKIETEMKRQINLHFDEIVKTSRGLLLKKGEEEK